MTTSQTLSRGLQALEFIALAADAPTIDDVASHLDVHRSVAYRLVRTLEAHRLTERTAAGLCVPGLRLSALGHVARPSLQSVAIGELAAAADDLAMTCFLVVADGDEALTVESLEPTTTQVHLAYKPGLRHPTDRGAPGLAVLAGRPKTADERPEVTTTRQTGWVMTTGEVIAGLTSIAVPLVDHDAAIAAVFLDSDEIDHHAIADRLVAGAATILDALAYDPKLAATA